MATRRCSYCGGRFSSAQDRACPDCGREVPPETFDDPFPQGASPRDGHRLPADWMPTHDTGPISKASIRNVPVSVPQITTHAVKAWRRNLGLLLGVWLVVFGINSGMDYGLRRLEQQQPAVNQQPPVQQPEPLDENPDPLDEPPGLVDEPPGPEVEPPAPFDEPPGPAEKAPELVEKPLQPVEQPLERGEDPRPMNQPKPARKPLNLQAFRIDWTNALLVGVIKFLVNGVKVFLGVGQTLIALKVARGRQAYFTDVLTGASQTTAVVGATLIATILLMLAFSACFVPGLFLCWNYWPFYFLIVDKKAGVFDSFTTAREITKNNLGSIILLCFVSALIALAGLLGCLVGFVFAAPLLTVLWATAYLMMSGQLAAPGTSAFQG
ncbi:hypothetical protein [Lignipirellula cremea]|uniref:Uncharacterized protein n=1 Tax=Lignipirellula cremea TaxID=2528010 RepID=A0A518DNM9_9BACT|nr:hypothetical protein [Lignipirellula cremea]QDU93448.1 hypothetical protein Pla8534_12280 [Lignipirellula cremea]